MFTNAELLGLRWALLATHISLPNQIDCRAMRHSVTKGTKAFRVCGLGSNNNKIMRT